MSKEMFRRTIRRTSLLIPCILSILVSVPAAVAQVPMPAAGVNADDVRCIPGLGLYFADLREGVRINLASAFINETVAPQESPNAACAGWQEAVLAIEIPESCTQASILLEYEGEPVGWTLNLGDSPANNGFGGDDGSQLGANAELQVLGNQLSLWNSASTPEEVDRFALANLALRDGSLRLVVGNQFVSWGQPYTAFDSDGLERLFAIPSTVDGRTVYLGLNRVISNSGRNGCGVRRVLVKFR